MSAICDGRSKTIIVETGEQTAQAYAIDCYHSMTEPITGLAIKPWKLSGAIWIGLVLLLFLFGGLFLDFKIRELLLPFYLTPFQRSQLLFLLLSPVSFAVAAYASMRIAKLHDLADLFQSIAWNPSVSLAVPAFLGLALAGVITAISVKLFGTSNQFDGYAPLSVLLFLLCSVLAQPFMEEFYYRGILFSAVANQLGVVAAVISTALLFSWFHPLHRLTILPIALLLGLTRMKTNSVAACLAQHAGYNLGILLFQYLY